MFDEKHTVVQKTSPLYHHCQTLFQAYYTPGCELAVDESMVRCKGRTPWKTTIKIKPIKTGYKMYTLASYTYLLAFTIYRCKGGYDTPHASLHHTVVDLMRLPHEAVRDRRRLCQRLWTANQFIKNHILVNKIQRGPPHTRRRMIAVMTLRRFGK